MRLSYHGWAAILLVTEFALVVGGVALGVTPTSPVSTLANGDPVTITCGSPWLPSVAETARCAAEFEGRGTMALLLIGCAVVLFGGQLLVGMLVAGVRDALATAAQRRDVVTTAGPAPSPLAPPA